MITVADAELLERETELHTLRAQLDSARHGRGTITLVEAPAGQGKTTLLRAVRAEASAAGLRTLSAIGADLERDFAFGIDPPAAPAVSRPTPARHRPRAGCTRCTRTSPTSPPSSRC